MSAQPVDYEYATITQITYREQTAPATRAAVERIAAMDEHLPDPRLRARIVRAASPSKRLRGI